MTFLTSVLMGVLQGVAEFLPISSSGHLALYQYFFRVENYEETQMFFTVLLHLGTLISTFVYYRREIGEMVRAVLAPLTGRQARRQREEISAGRLVLLIIVATLPLFLVMPLKDRVEAAMAEPRFVAVALLLTGFILWFSDRLSKGKKTEQNATLTDALLVGVAQGFGTLPGISRSGITISAGLLRGYDRGFAVRFSFLMAIPAVLGANLLTLIDVLRAGGVDVSLLPVYLAGTVTASVVGYFAIRLVNFLTRRGQFGAFAWYCWAAGLLSLAGILLF